MRPARPTTVAGPGRARRATAVVALGTLALVGAAPAVAVAAAPTPTPDATAPAAGAVPLPAEDQVDQVPAAPGLDAAHDEPSPDPSPSDAPTEEPSDEPTPSPSPTGTPGCPEVVTACFGTGKAYAEVSSQDGAPLAGAVLELDVAGTDPAPEWTGTTDAAGDVPGWYELPAGATATVRVVSVPAGSMVLGATSQTVGPCVAATEETPADCDLTASFELTRAYRVLDVVVADDAGAPLPGATFELWGAAPAAEPPAQVPDEPADPSPTDDPTRGSDDDHDHDHDDDHDDDDHGDEDDRDGHGHTGPGRGHDHHDDDARGRVAAQAAGDMAALAAPVPAGRVLVATATSDASGRLSFGRVAPGTYELRATAVPAGYALPTSTVPVTLDQVLAAADAQAPVAVRVPLRAVTPPGAGAPAAPPAASASPAAAAARTAARTGALAATGSPAGVLGGLAAGLLAAGLGSVAVARRSSRRASQRA
ncbi:SpaA isopeptide-forming pilin-related protein [Cellulomonas sp. NPDC057328]|uniref:SpaA isopeptide-forming pilin-related protein n=1 Tax=Cellulomonas sp. NPDC057328 TaxID=3346101 RepID=UPI00362CFC9F